MSDYPPLADVGASDGRLEPVGAGLRVQDAAVAADLFTRAAQANLQSPLRKGNTVHLPDTGWLTMTGDLHDNGLNLQRIVRVAALDRPDHHLILHEVIHGPYQVQGRDMSVRTLARVAALKLAYPDRVHILQSNHELAQYRGEGIVKDGISVVEAFDAGLDFIYGDDSLIVRAAMRSFLRSLPLAAKAPHEVFFAHSLPGARAMERFDPSVIDRELQEADLQPGGSAYNMVWGRSHNQQLAEDLADEWHTRLFVLGHQPAEFGYELEGDSILILASDHGHGMVLPIDLSKPDYAREDLVGQLVPLASVQL
jgi:hypothetical protein